MVVVELEQRALAVADLEEAHDLARRSRRACRSASRPSTAAAIRSATTGASKCAVEPAFESGRSVASPRAKTFGRPPTWRVCRSVGSQPPGRRGEAGVDEELLALVRRHEDQQVVRQLLALEALDDLALRVDRLDVEERVELDALLLEDRGGHLATRSRS